MSWWIYMLQCADGSYYLGSTNNVEKRVKTHQAGKGAKYTQAHLPVHLIYQEECVDKSTALKREIALKKLTHQQKSKLIKTT